MSTLLSALIVPVASSITSTFFATARTLLTLTGAPAPDAAADAGAAPEADAAAGAGSRPQPARTIATASAAALPIKLVFMQILVGRGSPRSAPIRYSL
jgi:hypothetical protein